MDNSINVWNKVNLSIDQVSQLTGVKKTTLRYWEKEFSGYLTPERTETQRRQYSMEEVEKVGVLKQLIEEEKYKSAGVRLKLGLDHHRPAQPVATATSPAATTSVSSPLAAVTPPLRAGFSSLTAGNISLTVSALGPLTSKAGGGG